MNKYILDIKKYKQPGNLTYAVVTDEMISDAKQRFNVKFPDCLIDQMESAIENM